MRKLNTVALAILLALTGASAAADEGKNESGKGGRDKAYSDEKDRSKDAEKRAKDDRKADEERGKQAEKRERDWRQREDAWHKESSKRWEDDRRRGVMGSNGSREEYFRDSHSNVRVPDGHLPPPGECRIWHPERPAGQQPPPGRCSKLASQVPAGAWLIQRPGADQRYAVSAYDTKQPGLIFDRAVFDYRGGALVLVPSPR